MILAALSGGLLLLAWALRVQAWRESAPPLPPLAPSPEWGSTTILLPVRDEQHNVVHCIEGLLAQTAAPAVRVIDDGSRDGTAALAAAIAAREPRLQLLPAGPLPEGWLGKVHALAVGAAGVETDWLLSTDADARHHPELLAGALAAATEHRLDALSVAGSQEARGPGENLLTPAVFAVLDGLLGDWQAAATGGPTVANGQFILLRRTAWEACGGFASIRRPAIIDDVALAERMRSCGYRTGFWRAPGKLRVRMYRGAGETFRGWRRNLPGIFARRPGAVAAVLALALLPPLALLAALALGDAPAAFLLWAAGAAASLLLRRGSDHPPLYGLLYPLDALALAGTLILGLLDRRRGRPARWKGREMQA